MSRIAAIIPVRRNIHDNFGGNKDILPFGENNLLIHKIKQLKNVREVDVIVTTEDKYLAELAQKEGVEVIYRPLQLSDNSAHFGDFVSFICGCLNYDLVLWACVTSPMVDEKIYDRAINTFKEKREAGYDSLVSVQRMQRYLMDKNGALNYRTGDKFKAIEDLPSLYIFTNGISIAQRVDMLKWKYTSGNMPFFLELNKKEAIDICDEYDYQCAQFFAELKK